MMIVSISSWVPNNWFRIALLRFLGAKIDFSIALYHGYQVRNPKGLKIYPDTVIGEGCILDARGSLTIEESVNISSNVQIWTAQHDWKDPNFEAAIAKVTIGHHSWLGPNVIVLPGTTIGEGSVIAAGSVTHGEILPWGLYAGAPAKRIGERPRDMGYKLGGSAQKVWWW